MPRVMTVPLFVPSLFRAFVATLVLLVATWPAVAGTGPAPTALLVPLDDRPSTYLFPQQIARIGGGRLLTPPRRLLGRAWTPGDPERLARWLSHEAAGAERAIVSSDMLAYGGLVASRTAACPVEEALSNLQVLNSLKEDGVPVVALAIIPRLSLRTSEAQAPYETALANWAASGASAPPAQVPAAVVQEYLSVRRRNLQVMQALVQRVADGSVHSLVLGQDDSAPRGPHLDEQRLLEEQVQTLGLGDRVRVVSGADELAMNLVAGWLASREGLVPALEIRYSEEGAGQQIPPLESRPLDEAVACHLALSGARRSEGQGTVLLVEVPSSRPFQPPSTEAGPEDLERAAGLRGRFEQARAEGRRVALADLRLVNRADPVLARELLDRVPLWELEAYAAWNTPSNALGTVVAQAVVHEVARQRGASWTAERVIESEKTQQAFTFARLLDDYAYQALIRPTLTEGVRGLPRDPDPLLNLYGPAGLQARGAAVAWARSVWEQRLRGRTYRVPALGRLLEFRDLRVEVVLPWPRVFEIEARVDLRLAPAAATPAPEAAAGPREFRSPEAKGPRP